MDWEFLCFLFLKAYFFYFWYFLFLFLLFLCDFFGRTGFVESCQWFILVALWVWACDHRYLAVRGLCGGLLNFLLERGQSQLLFVVLALLPCLLFLQLLRWWWLVLGLGFSLFSSFLFCFLSYFSNLLTIQNSKRRIYQVCLNAQWHCVTMNIRVNYSNKVRIFCTEKLYTELLILKNIVWMLITRLWGPMIEKEKEKDQPWQEIGRNHWSCWVDWIPSLCLHQQPRDCLGSVQILRNRLG